MHFENEELGNKFFQKKKAIFMYKVNSVSFVFFLFSIN